MDWHREWEETGREAEEGEEREGNEDPEVGGEREDQVRQDPEEKDEREDQDEDVAYKLLNGQDEGFKEDDGERGEGAKKWVLTRQWMDLFFYDSEVDGDEGFEDDGEEEREQPRVEDERGERLTKGTERDSSMRVHPGEGEEEQLQPRVGEEDEWRGRTRGDFVEETGRRTKLESLHKDWETWDEKGLRRGDTKRPWRFDERGESSTRGGGSFGEIKLDCKEARDGRDSNKRGQPGRSAAEENGVDLRLAANKRMKKEIKMEI